MKTKQFISTIILGLCSFLNFGQISSFQITSYGGSTGTLGTASAFFGYQAGKNVTASTGGNSFFGNKAGNTVTTGTGNNLFGASAGGAITTGSNNAMFGVSNSSITTGSQNSYFGSNAGPYTNSNNIVCIGNNTMNYNTTASLMNCTAIGSEAGLYGYGNENIFLGYRSGYNKTCNNSIFIGNNVAETANNRLLINNDASTPLIWGDFLLDQVKLNGKVGVGAVTTFPTLAGAVDVSNYKLFVTGGILTEEVRVNLRGTNGLWADYVFNKDYKLPSLQEVEKQIQEKGHLANMPSAKEVKENGIELGEMAKMQQEKIEELTLYIIEQNKTNEKQSKEIAELKALVNKLINK
jgi:hypothetical protein